MTADEVLALPASVDLATAAKALGIGTTLAYELARAGELPVCVLRIGRLYRVPKSSLLEVLGLSAAAEPQELIGLVVPRLSAVRDPTYPEEADDAGSASA